MQGCCTHVASNLKGGAWGFKFRESQRSQRVDNEPKMYK